MASPDLGLLSRDKMVQFFVESFTPRDRWQIGLEVEKMGRDSGGAAIPYEADGPSVRGVLEAYRAMRGGAPVWEGDHLIGIDSEDWGTISLEPAGQVEWSSKPAPDLDVLNSHLSDHLRALDRAGDECGVRWLDVAVEPELAVDAMPWMPKARYGIMRPYMGARGRLSHRMMTQTASIQCAFDFEDARDWTRKFVTAARLAPLAVALFANSSRVDGRESGYRSYRQAIWRETAPERTGLPAVVFEPGFGIEAWVDWILSVPAMFIRRARGLVPAGGVPFARLMERTGCDSPGIIDWELHLSGVFTEVRSYSYLEVRSADLLPDPLIPAVPALWVGVLYDPDGLDAAEALGRSIPDHTAWRNAMDSAARDGMAGRYGDRRLADAAEDLIRIASRGIENGATCAGDPAAGVDALERLRAARKPGSG